MISSVAARGNTLAMSNPSKRFAQKPVVPAVVPLRLQWLKFLNQQPLQLNNRTQHQLRSKNQLQNLFKLQFTAHLSTQSPRFLETDPATSQPPVASPRISTLDQSSSSRLKPSTSQSTKSRSTRLQSSSSRLPAVINSLVAQPGNRSVEMHLSKNSALELAVFAVTNHSITSLQSLQSLRSLCTGQPNALLSKLPQSFSNLCTSLSLQSLLSLQLSVDAVINTQTAKPTATSARTESS